MSERCVRTSESPPSCPRPHASDAQLRLCTKLAALRATHGRAHRVRASTPRACRHGSPTIGLIVLVSPVKGHHRAPSSAFCRQSLELISHRCRRATVRCGCSGPCRACSRAEQRRRATPQEAPERRVPCAPGRQLRGRTSHAADAANAAGRGTGSEGAAWRGSGRCWSAVRAGRTRAGTGCKLVDDPAPGTVPPAATEAAAAGAAALRPTRGREPAPGDRARRRPARE